MYSSYIYYVYTDCCCMEDKLLSRENIIWPITFETLLRDHMRFGIDRDMGESIYTPKELGLLRKMGPNGQ